MTRSLGRGPLLASCGSLSFVVAQCCPTSSQRVTVLTPVGPGSGAGAPLRPRAFSHSTRMRLFFANHAVQHDGDGPGAVLLLESL